MVGESAIHTALNDVNAPKVMTPKLIHTIWTTIEESAPSGLLHLSDRELAKQLVQEIQHHHQLAPAECSEAWQYIYQKACLIRDVVVQC